MTVAESSLNCEADLENEDLHKVTLPFEIILKGTLHKILTVRAKTTAKTHTKPKPITIRKYHKSMNWTTGGSI